MTELPPISLEGYALTHEDVERMKNDAEKELQETRKELGFIEESRKVLTQNDSKTVNGEP